MARAAAARAMLADVLDYPGPGFPGRVCDAIDRLAPAFPATVDKLRRFHTSIRGLPLGRLQELYTGTFDFCPECDLHAGWHLFGDDPRRGIFLVGLVERYRERGFSVGNELPDHVPALLRFAGVAGDSAAEIVADALLPALEALGKALEKLDSPYCDAIAAAAELLREECTDSAPRAGTVSPRGGGARPEASG